MNIELHGEFLGSDRDVLIKEMSTVQGGSGYIFGVEPKEWGRYYDLLMPAYIQAVRSKGYKPFVAGSAEGDRLYNYLRNLTLLPGGVIMRFLQTLQQQAQAGKIDLGLWSPKVEAQAEAYRPKTPLETALEKAGSAATKGASEQFTKILFFGVLAVGAYAFLTVGLPRLARG